MISVEADINPLLLLYLVRKNGTPLLPFRDRAARVSSRGQETEKTPGFTSFNGNYWAMGATISSQKELGGIGARFRHSEGNKVEALFMTEGEIG